jgi:hypothetical protein
MKATDSIPICCLHSDAYPTMTVSQKEMTSRLSRFYMMTSSNLDDMEQHIQQSELPTNVQILHDLAMYFIRKVASDDEPDPNYQEGMEIIKQECKNIIDILEQDLVTRNFRALMKIYIPQTTGVADEDKPYLDWMEALIHDLLTARPMWQPVFNLSQTSTQILAITYSGFYNTPMNKEISDIIDLSMEMDSMDRVTRPCANTNEHNKQCFSEISGKKVVVHISCTSDDSTVDFTRNKAEEKHLFDFVWNMCSPGTDRKLKRISVSVYQRGCTGTRCHRIRTNPE